MKEGKKQQATHLVDQSGLSVWHKQSQLEEPKGSFKLQLNNDLNDQSPAARIKNSMLQTILQKQLADLNFVTQEAGLSFSITSQNGLLISTSGYSDKQDELLLTLIDHLKSMKIDEQSLRLAKQELTRRLNNKSKGKAMDLGLDGFRQVIRQPAWSDETLLAQVDAVSTDDLTKLVSDIFSQSSVRLLALGNFSSTNVLQLTAQLKTKINIQPAAFIKLSV